MSLQNSWGCWPCACVVVTCYLKTLPRDAASCGTVCTVRPTVVIRKSSCNIQCFNQKLKSHLSKQYSMSQGGKLSLRSDITSVTSSFLIHISCVLINSLHRLKKKSIFRIDKIIKAFFFKALNATTLPLFSWSFSSSKYLDPQYHSCLKVSPYGDKSSGIMLGETLVWFFFLLIMSGKHASFSVCFC